MYIMTNEEEIEFNKYWRKYPHLQWKVAIKRWYNLKSRKLVPRKIK